MKRIILSAILGLLILTITGQASAITIGFAPASQTAPVGTSISVDLIISDLGNYSAPSLGTFDLDVGYNSSILSFNSVSFGLYLGNPSLSEALTSYNDSVPGTLNLLDVSLLEANSSTCILCIPPYLDDLQPSSFTLATLTFDTLAAGTSPLALVVTSLGDAYGDPLAPGLGLTIENGSVTVEARPVPEPGTLLLLGSGLIGVVALRRKRLFR